MGRLSNPLEFLETVAPQGIRGLRKSRERRSRQPTHSPTSSESAGPETPGWISNPARRTILRRLNDVEIDDLATEYRAGRTLADLAHEFGIHPRTVAARLNTRDVPRRINRRKMSDYDVDEAIRRYRSGDSLATVALTFNVNAATVRREFRRAGVAIRP